MTHIKELIESAPKVRVRGDVVTVPKEMAGWMLQVPAVDALKMLAWLGEIGAFKHDPNFFVLRDAIPRIVGKANRVIGRLSYDEVFDQLTFEIRKELGA